MLSSNFQQQNVHEWGSNKNVLSAAIEALNPKKYQIYVHEIERPYYISYSWFNENDSFSIHAPLINTIYLSLYR